MRNGRAQQVWWEENYRHRSAVCVAMPAFGPPLQPPPPISDLMKVNEAAVNVNQKHSIQKALSHNQLTLVHMWSSPIAWQPTEKHWTRHNNEEAPYQDTKGRKIPLLFFFSSDFAIVSHSYRRKFPSTPQNRRMLTTTLRDFHCQWLPRPT